MTLIRSLWVALAVSIISLPSFATPLKQDPNWTLGQLDNGFQYRLRNIDESSDRIQVYLWVKSGSADETPEQKGAAHLLEHMGFNGTKHFPGHKISELFKQAGLSFGQDLNAYTSFNDTVYTLNIPEHDTQLMSNVLLYLSDIAQHIELDAKEVEKEIGVVKGEYYAREHLSFDPALAYMDKMSQGSEYTMDKVTGLPAQLDTLNAVKLKDFYKKWYRPDNMELLVVGNFKQAELIEQINQQFSRLHGKTATKQRAATPTFSRKTQTFTSTQVAHSGIGFNFILPNKAYITEQDAINTQLVYFTNEMISYRLARANELSEQPFISANSYVGTPTYLNDLWLFSLNVKHERGQVQPSLAWLGAEIAKINQFGFTDAEFKQQQQLYNKNMSNLEAKYNNLTSYTIMHNMLNALQQGDTPVSLEQDKLLLARFIDNLTLAQVNQFAQQILVKPQIYQTAANGDALNSHNKLESWTARSLAQPVQAYSDTQLVSASATASEKAPQGEIVAQQTYPKYGIEHLTLDNGLEVILQPDNTAKGKIYFHLVAPGGFISLDAKYRTAAAMLANVQLNSGLGELSAQQVEKQFIANNTVINPFINATLHGLEGSTRTADLDFALAGIKQAVLSTKINPQVFNITKKSFFDYSHSNSVSYIGMLDARIESALYGNNPYQGPLSLKQIKQTQAKDLLSVKQQLFGSANGFKLTLVGDFELDAAKQLIKQHIASLPGGQKHQYNQKKHSATSAKTEINAQVNENKSADVMFEFVYQDVEPSVKQIYAADLVGRIVREQLFDQVREELSLTYSPDAWCAMISPGLNYAKCRIHVLTAVEDADQAKLAVQEVLAKLYTTGVSETELQQTKGSLATAMLDTFKDTASRASFIQRDFILGYPIGATLETKQVLASIDKPYIDNLIKQMLQNAGQVSLINLPK